MSPPAALAFDLDLLGGPTALSDLIDAVLAAGRLAVDHFRAGAAGQMQRKADHSPVTEADRAAEAHLRGFCQARFPHAAFLGEEDGASGADAAVLRFVVDPVDGTRAFIRGLPSWSVLVGLEHAGEPVLGIAYMPADDDLFVAVRGHGATRNGRPLHLSDIDRMDEATISHGGLRQFTDAGLAHLLPRLARATYTQRGFGDFDGYRQLLLGRVDAVIDPGLTPWDMCAPAAIVREAGGRFTDLDGQDTIHGGGALASNGRVHDALLALIAAPREAG
jgi:histidinol phosphatase-like enzyme (inositol monophosphatase family)